MSDEQCCYSGVRWDDINDVIERCDACQLFDTDAQAAAAWRLWPDDQKPLAALPSMWR